MQVRLTPSQPKPLLAGWRIRVRWAWLVCLGWLFGPLVVPAQVWTGTSGWYTPGQAYLKLETTLEGIYRLPADSILVHQPSFAGAQLSRLQLFFRGTEQALHVEDADADGLLSAGDAIEFYAPAPDGALEADLFRSSDVTGRLAPEFQSNPLTSLFSQRVVFFLTVGTTNGLRYQASSTQAGDLAGLTPEPFYRARVDTAFRNAYITGNASGTDARYTLNADWVAGEGYGSGIISTQLRFSMLTPFAVASPATQPVLQLRYAGFSLGAHEVRISFGSAQLTESFSNIGINTASVTGTASDLVSGSVTVQSQPILGNGQQIREYFRVLDYDRQFRFSGEREVALESWTPSGPGPHLLSLTGVNVPDGDSAILYDLTDGLRILGLPGRTATNQDTARFVLPPATGSHRLYYSAGSRRRLPVRLTAVTGPTVDEAANAAELVIITRRALSPSAEAYKAYRDTSSRNRLSTTIVYLDELYDAYTYGHPNPLAIKRFVYRALNGWSTAPRYFLLWGKAKGINGYQLDDPIALPSWGLPASDIEFVSNFSETQRNHAPVAAIGRVNLLTDATGFAYLDKVIEYEQSPFEGWMKKAIHLGGGNETSEQEQIQSIFEGLLRPIREDLPYFGTIFYHQKFSNAIVDAGTSQNIRNNISGGSGVLTFFGHSSSNLFDVELEEATSYTNYGRYPFIIANGCYSGDFTAASYSFAERFLLEPGRGCIGYVSLPSTGIISFMASTVRELYERLLNDPGIRVGDAHTAAVSDYLQQGSNSSNPFGIQHAQQYNLQGDPSLRFYYADGPDFVATPSVSMQFEPAQPTVQLDSFLVRVAVENQGLYTADSFSVQLRQTVTASNTVLAFPLQRISLGTNADTLVFVVRKGTVDLGGINQFELLLDAQNDIAEIDEINNRLVEEVNVISDIPAILYPWPGARVETDTLSLQAALYNDRQHIALGYEFELDTLPTFDSPTVQRSGVVNGTSYLGNWRVPGALQPGRTYFWRVRATTAGPDSWAHGQFTVVPSALGYALRSPFQFAGVSRTDLAFDSTARRFDYPQTPIEVRVQNRPFDNYFFVEGNALGLTDFIFSSGRGFFYCLFEAGSGEVITPQSNWGNLVFMPPPIDTLALSTLLDTLPVGTGIMLYGGRNHGLDLRVISNGLKDRFRAFGAQQILNLGPVQSFILLGRKGLAPGEAAEDFAPDDAAIYRLIFEDNTVLRARPGSGTLRTDLIGPAAAWQNLTWGWRTVDAVSGDAAALTLYAVRPNGSDSLYQAGVPATSALDLSSLDASLYPFVRAELVLADDPNRTPPQPDSLTVAYVPLPELTLDALTDYTAPVQALVTGQTGRIRLGVRNPSRLPADTTNLVVDLVLESGGVSPVGALVVPPLNPGAFAVLEDTFATAGLSGSGFVRVRLGQPNDTLKRQPERLAFNNLFLAPIEISGDATNPSVDVLFDGRRIVNGDIVSPQPVITIEVRDDNPFLQITDTSSVEVFLNPVGATPVPGGGRVFYEPGVLEFQPAAANESGTEKNAARVVFTPQALEDGDYELTIRAQDASQNLSGDEPYAVAFRVENRSRITQVINYPNPFSTQTRWVYTLTGSVLPEVFQIHIYTVSGRLVKIIDLVELGEVRVGTHETQWAWDGTDDFGDPLANGVYLYRTVLKMPAGQEVELDGSQTAQYFKKGWGKLVILR